MKNLKLSERIQLLEEMGVDTSKYNLSFDGLKLEVNDTNVKDIVEDKHIDNKKLFRRWITAQTFRMMNTTVYDPLYQEYRINWDSYLRVMYPYMYQFSMTEKELKDLMKLEINDKEELEIRSHFFNKEIVVELCKHYLSMLHKYINKNSFIKGDKLYVKLSKYGTVEVSNVPEIFTNKLASIIGDIALSDTYAELYSNFKRFRKMMNKLPSDTNKCSAWKNAFKGAGAYYSLKNIIMFHDVCLYEYNIPLSKEDSLRKLDCLLEIYKGEEWKFHQLLKETVELNNFNFIRSISK